MSILSSLQHLIVSNGGSLLKTEKMYDLQMAEAQQYDPFRLASSNL